MAKRSVRKAQRGPTAGGFPKPAPEATVPVKLPNPSGLFDATGRAMVPGAQNIGESKASPAGTAQRPVYRPPADQLDAIPVVDIKDPSVGALEFGALGLRHWGGRVYEEFLKELRFEQGWKNYREMPDNDPVIRASHKAVKLLIRAADWRVEPAS